MRNTMRFPSVQIIKSLPKFHIHQYVRKASHEYGGNHCSMFNEDFEHFPEKKNLIREEYNIKKEEESYRKFLLDELLTECGLNESFFPLHGIEKEFIITVDIGILKKVGILTNDAHITENLLSYIEPFPFIKQTSDLWIAKEFLQSEKFVTIKEIRDFIEREYLAWKFKVDAELIKNILIHLRSCLFLGRSLRSAKRNFDLINEVPQVKIQSVANKLFLMNMRPFKIETLLNFKETFFGYDWDDAAHFFPEIMRKPYPYIMLFVKTLQSKGFSETQIKKALPFLRMNLLSLLRRLNYLLSSSELSNFQCDNDFLRLLYFNHTTLPNLVDVNQKSFKELLSLIDESERNSSRRFSTQELYHHLSKKLKINKDHLKVLQRHPRLLLTSATQISSTINFLRQMQFNEKEIIESITIVLYPRENIKKTLLHLKEKEKVLHKLGFLYGSVSEETHFFQLGTKLKRKTLQLCLYYMEKNYNFSENELLLAEN